MRLDENSRVAAYESDVRNAFAFLETNCGMTYSGLRKVEEGPGDSGLVARYRGDRLRVDIGWSEAELVLMVLIRLDRDELSSQTKYIYLDAFVEFFSHGTAGSIVPQIYPHMNQDKILDVAKKRTELFEKMGFLGVLGKMAEQLRDHIGDIQNAPLSTIREYHDWYGRGGP